jgi:hypothetical protein
MPSAQSLTRFLVSPEAHLSITEYESKRQEVSKQTNTYHHHHHHHRFSFLFVDFFCSLLSLLSYVGVKSTRKSFVL